MSNWQNLSPMGQGQPGSPTVGGGGTGQSTTLSGYRSILDAKRSAALTGRTPEAEYPDGYLGDVNSRRQDRLVGSVQGKLTDRSYQRGVHKGERVPAQDYYWNAEVNPQVALEAEANGYKWTQAGSTPIDQINHMGKNHMLPPEQFDQIANSVGVSTGPTLADPVRRARMGRLLPTWS